MNKYSVGSYASYIWSPGRSVVVKVIAVLGDWTKFDYGVRLEPSGVQIMVREDELTPQ